MELAHRIYGNGNKTLVILHGLFGMNDNWHQVAQQLSDTYKVITLDLRNHGNSPHDADMTYDLMADDVAETLEKLGVEKAVIIGHSMGGKTAMNFALRYYEKTEKLLVADIAPKTYKRGHDDIFDALFSIDLSGFETRGEIDKFLTPSLSDFGTRQFILKNLGRDAEGKFYWKMNIEGIYTNYENIIASGLREGQQFSGETLFIKGARSRYITESDEATIREFFPNAAIHTIENSGHWIHAENPARVIEEIRTFAGV